MVDKVSRISRITMEKNDHEQTKDEEEKKQPEKFKDMLEQVVTGIVEKNRGV